MIQCIITMGLATKMLKNHYTNKLMRSLTTTYEHFMPTKVTSTRNDERDKRDACPYRFKKYTKHSVRATAITLSNRHKMGPPRRTAASFGLLSSLHNSNTQRCAIELHLARLYSLVHRFRSIHKLLNRPSYSSEVISQTPLYFTVFYRNATFADTFSGCTIGSVQIAEVVTSLNHTVK